MKLISSFLFLSVILFEITCGSPLKSATNEAAAVETTVPEGGIMVRSELVEVNRIVKGTLDEFLTNSGNETPLLFSRSDVSAVGDQLPKTESDNEQSTKTQELPETTTTVDCEHSRQKRETKTKKWSGSVDVEHQQ